MQKSVPATLLCLTILHLEVTRGQGSLPDRAEPELTTSTTTTTPTSTTTSTSTPGILIAGGCCPWTSAELFFPSNGKSCSVSDLPADKAWHSLNTLGNTPVLCHGYTCLQFTQASTLGAWSDYATTVKSRSDGHSSWVSPAGLVLMGRDNTTEIVPSGGGNFSLVENTWAACAIDDKDSTIVTGGLTNSKRVIRYNLQGFVENLPAINQGRWAHGCGSFVRDGNKVLIVAGGHDFDRNFASTEIFIAGATAWLTVNPLPGPRHGVAAVSMENKFYLLGGHNGGGSAGVSGAKKEILAFDGENWTPVGELRNAKWGLAATTINARIEGFC